MNSATPAKKATPTYPFMGSTQFIACVTQGRTSAATSARAITV
jgi:hypothetical protein